VLEAMKMENDVVAAGGGICQRIGSGLGGGSVDTE